MSEFASLGRNRGIAPVLLMERLTFAAKVRVARAVTGLSQSMFAARIGMTQRSVHTLEHGGTEPRRTTVVAIEKLWREQGVEFQDLPGGGFQVVVRAVVIETQAPKFVHPARRRRRPRGHVESLRV